MSLHKGPAQQQEQQQEQQQRRGAQMPAAAEGQFDAPAACSHAEVSQASLHSAAAQTSEVLEPAAPAVVADASVQAESSTVEAGAGTDGLGLPDQQQQQGAVELAQLILGAFEKSGGVIVPDGVQPEGSISDRVGAAVCGPQDAQQQQQRGSSWGLLQSPYAGAAAPQFEQVMDLQPGDFLGSGDPASCGAEVFMAEDEEGLGPAAQQELQPEYEVCVQEQQSMVLQPLVGVSSTSALQHGCCFAACSRHITSPELGASKRPQLQARTRTSTAARNGRTGSSTDQQQSNRGTKAGNSRSTAAEPSLPRRSTSTSARRVSAGNNSNNQCGNRSVSHVTGVTLPARQLSQQQAQQLQGQTAPSRAQALAKQSSSRQPVSPHTWACEQTKQLDELWQLWHKQQTKTLSAAGQSVQPAPDQQQAAPAAVPSQRTQAKEDALLAAKERQELEDAYARASAARASAKKAAQHAAAARSQRLRAELMDLGRMLAEVDTLAAQMEVESTQAAAAVKQFEADLNRSRQLPRSSVVGSLRAAT
jgi:hypothetical protein